MLLFICGFLQSRKTCSGTFFGIICREWREVHRHVRSSRCYWSTSAWKTVSPKASKDTTNMSEWVQDCSSNTLLIVQWNLNFNCYSSISLPRPKYFRPWQHNAMWVYPHLEVLQKGNLSRSVRNMTSMFGWVSVAQSLCWLTLPASML